MPTLVSPDGRRSAVVRRSGGKALNARDTIWVTDSKTHASRPVYSTRVFGDTSGLDSPGPIELKRWSDNGRWIFFAIDPGFSASIAADGLRLRVVSASGGAAHAIATMLNYEDYLAWCGGRLVFTAGFDREATVHKQLDEAAPPDWTPHPLTDLRGRAWGSLACAPDGRSVVVQSQPEAPLTSFFATRWQLWRVGLDGTTTQLTQPPVQHADESPHFSRDGRTIYFVRSRRGHGQLYALRGGRMIGPLLSLGYSLGYYGANAWAYIVR